MDNLTPQLNDTQIRQNIDYMRSKNIDTNTIQSYVNNYTKDASGNYVLKSAQQPAQPKPDLLQKTGDIVNSIFPGKQVGQAIGTLGGLAAEKIKGAFGGQDNSKFYDTSAPSPLQVGGDVAQGALMVAAPNIGAGESVGGRIAANTALGTGLGGAGAIAEGKGVGDVAKSTALGGAVGGGVSALGEGVRALTENLPKWLTNMALPKLENKNIPYAMENTKIGSLPALQKQSSASMENYESQIQGILSHPEFKSVAEDSGSILKGALEDRKSV